jgi:hypothetical protein
MKPIILTLTVLSSTSLGVLHAAEASKPMTESPAEAWPEPPVFEPKYDGTPVPAPTNAVVIFDGRDASAWVRIPMPKDTNQSTQFTWKVANGYMEVVTPPGARQQSLVGTKESPITSGHLHIEWATPTKVKGNSQGRGNSGVFIDGFPELQVLDSFNNKTYFDGQAGALYKHRPPLVNASRGPGLWQCYDIYIQRAKVTDGKIVEPEAITVFHNHVLVQDHQKFDSPVQTSPLRLQDHLNPVHFRNIWFAPGETEPK